MKVLIPCAGQSQRFKDAGYDQPKALLPVHTNTGASVLMARFASSNVDVSFQRLYGVHPFDVNVFQPLLHDDAKLIAATHCTFGQSGTIYDLLLACDPEESVLVLNCDVFHDLDIGAFIMQVHNDGDDCRVSVIHTNGPFYSYIDNYPSFQFAVEKIVISQYALSGMYYFKKSKFISAAIEQQFQINDQINGEFYLSEALHQLDGSKVASLYDRANIHDLGTPELYQIFNRGAG